MHRSEYVQDERYNAGAWMHRSEYVQDERYNAGAWMHRSEYVQDERYSAGAWPFKAIHGFTALKHLGNCSCITLITYIL
jgi:hypothetical protein